MKKCIRCGMALPDDSLYCTSCGTDQHIDFKAQLPQQKQDDTFLKVLCILTIVGACFSLISIPMSMLRPSFYEEKSVLMMLGTSLVIAITKLAGAIFMLQKKLSGLYLYTVGAAMSIVVGIWSAFTISGTLGVTTTFQMAMSLVALIFPVAFLIMYWLPVNKRVLS
ncbi:hypothetical protein HYN59_10730 [Flavobacterium album]|uniref:Zinc ribbon domain-containing protein n=1 Tax=Flavobacterium album TaxID=2175091 RepID=A0A2S1QYU4_9FLAO|nr:zinc ribbon domain-containing protein [Flavobacterium album]AWH85555.1 hypothetical protein HYN59_10730 [Flavobacterium album]